MGSYLSSPQTMRFDIPISNDNTSKLVVGLDELESGYRCPRRPRGARPITFKQPRKARVNRKAHMNLAELEAKGVDLELQQRGPSVAIVAAGDEVNMEATITNEKELQPGWRYDDDGPIVAPAELSADEIVAPAELDEADGELVAPADLSHISTSKEDKSSSDEEERRSKKKKKKSLRDRERDRERSERHKHRSSRDKDKEKDADHESERHSSKKKKKSRRRVSSSSGEESEDDDGLTITSKSDKRDSSRPGGPGGPGAASNADPPRPTFY
eukprot:g60080.t1